MSLFPSSLPNQKHQKTQWHRDLRLKAKKIVRMSFRDLTQLQLIFQPRTVNPISKSKSVQNSRTYWGEEAEWEEAILSHRIRTYLGVETDSRHAVTRSSNGIKFSSKFLVSKDPFRPLH